MSEEQTDCRQGGASRGEGKRVKGTTRDVKRGKSDNGRRRRNLVNYEENNIKDESLS